MATDVTPVTGHAIDQERKKLKKVLHRFDLVFFTIAAFISLDTIALTAAYGGGETFVWLAFLIIVYLIPYGMIIAEMGSAFPVEGGPYAWVAHGVRAPRRLLHRGHLLGLSTPSGSAARWRRPAWRPSTA